MLLLARHGRTAYNAEGRFQGQSAVPLDDHGRDEAFALAGLIAGRGDVTRMVSSPLTRALETAAIIAARTGLAPEVEPRLAETDCGAWTHRAYADVIAEDPDGYAAFRRLEPDYGAPGGETFGQQLARVRAAIEAIRAVDEQTDGDGTTLVVCHGNVVRLLLRHEHGEAPGHDEVPNTHLVRL